MFNIFKRKEGISQSPRRPKTVLCIPGPWKDRSAIVTSIAERNLGQFIFAGATLLNIKTSQAFDLEIHEKDERMKDSFKAAGLINRLSDSFLGAIDKHSHVVYLVAETGNMQDAKAIAEAGMAILNAGGIGVKVESAGKAFSKAQWTNLASQCKAADLYEMFVVDSIHDGHGTTYSCGMHNLGFRDTVVSGIEFQEAVRLISTFNYYQVVETPRIAAKQTFSISHDSPVFIIENEPEQPGKGYELFENPYGVWRLRERA